MSRVGFLLLCALFALAMFELGRFSVGATPVPGPQAKVTERIA